MFYFNDLNKVNIKNKSEFSKILHLNLLIKK